MCDEVCGLLRKVSKKVERARVAVPAELPRATLPGELLIGEELASTVKCVRQLSCVDTMLVKTSTGRGCGSDFCEVRVCKWIDLSERR